VASLTDRIRIEFEDNNVIVVDKPAGLLTMATDKERLKTVYAVLREHLNAKREKLFIVHRLDREASGLLVFAKTIEAKEYLQDQFKRCEGRIHDPVVPRRECRATRVFDKELASGQASGYAHPRSCAESQNEPA
jgi:hypothetical protein